MIPRGMPGMSVAKAFKYLASKGYVFLGLFFNVESNSQFVAVV